MTQKQSQQQAAFGAGCFWHVEETFRTTRGVLTTRAGYAGGTTKNPTYEEVCSGETGHIEAVEVTFDPAIISYDQILDIFFELHNPTSKDKQGPDEGTQYRSAIFAYSPEQRARAESKIKSFTLAKKYSKPIVTVILEKSEFYPAEDYHQKFLMKRGKTSCRF